MFYQSAIGEGTAKPGLVPQHVDALRSSLFAGPGHPLVKRLIHFGGVTVLTRAQAVVICELKQLQNLLGVNLEAIEENPDQQPVRLFFGDTISGTYLHHMVTNSLAEFGNNYSPRVLVEKSRRSHHDRGIFLRTVALQKLVRVEGIFDGTFG